MIKSFPSYNIVRLPSLLGQFARVVCTSLTTLCARDSPVCCCFKYSFTSRKWFPFYAPAMIDREHIVFPYLFVCPSLSWSACLQKRLQWQLLLSSKWLCTPCGPFLWYQGQGHLSRSSIKVTFQTQLVSIFLCVCSVWWLTQNYYNAYDLWSCSSFNP